MPSSFLRVSFVVACGAVLALAASSCASPGLRAAEAGDRAALARWIDTKLRDGSLTNGEAARLGRAVAARDLAEARGPAARERVRDATLCADDLDDALADRSHGTDAAAADAALARLSAGHGSASRAREHAGDADDAFRAWGARGLVGTDHGTARRKAFLDPAPGVRRSAVEAAAAEADSSDIGALLEVARLDPEPALRNAAVRALAPTRGKDAATVALRLRDLWPAGDEPLRDDLAAAWATGDVYTSGGREALRTVLATEPSSAGVGAAVVALRAGNGGKDDGDDVRSLARARLLRALTDGTRRERLRAVPVVPRDLAVGSLRDLAAGADRDVAVAALLRIAENAADRAAVVTNLEARAAEKGPPGASARDALAQLGVLRVQAWLEEDLHAAPPESRLGAARSLATLGRSARAARLLVDESASIRMRAACILQEGARRHP